MRTVFADTFYWIALANPRDEWHQATSDAAQNLASAQIITTDEVLAEFLTYYCGFGSVMRGIAAQLVRRIVANPTVTVLPQSRESFLSGLELYEARPDKQFSLTDCIAMHAMRTGNLREVLTNDHHFEQEGFVILLTDKSK